MTGFDVETRLADYFTWLEDSTGQAMSPSALQPPRLAIVDPLADRHESTFSRPGRRWLVLAAASIALLVGSVAVLWPQASDQPVWAAEAVAIANDAPRLLVDGWDVEGVGAFSVENGEVTFESNGRNADIFWTPGSRFADLVDDRSRSSADTTAATAGNVDWTIFDYSGSEYRAVGLIQSHTVEVVASPTAESEFVDLLDKIEIVDVDTWLSALPDSIVQPTNQVGVVEQMTADIPLPPGLALSDITDTNIVGNRTQVAIEVLRPVVCGWIDTWFTANDAGDQQLSERAEEVLGATRKWAIVQEMGGGLWFESLLQRTDAVATGSLITDGSSPEPIDRDNLSGIGC